MLGSQVGVVFISYASNLYDPGSSPPVGWDLLISEFQVWNSSGGEKFYQLAKSFPGLYMARSLSGRRCEALWQPPLIFNFKHILHSFKWIMTISVIMRIFFQFKTSVSCKLSELCEKNKYAVKCCVEVNY